MKVNAQKIINLHESHILQSDTYNYIYAIFYPNTQ